MLITGFRLNFGSCITKSESQQATNLHNSIFDINSFISSTSVIILDNLLISGCHRILSNFIDLLNHSFNIIISSITSE